MYLAIAIVVVVDVVSDSSSARKPKRKLIFRATIEFFGYFYDMRLATLCDEQQHLNDERQKRWKENGTPEQEIVVAWGMTLMQKHEKKRDFAFQTPFDDGILIFLPALCLLFCRCSLYNIFCCNCIWRETPFSGRFGECNEIHTNGKLLCPASPTVARANFLAQYVFTCDCFCMCIVHESLRENCFASSRIEAILHIWCN